MRFLLLQKKKEKNYMASKNEKKIHDNDVVMPKIAKVYSEHVF